MSKEINRNRKRGKKLHGPPNKERKHICKCELTEDEPSEDSILEEIFKTLIQDVREKAPTAMKGKSKYKRNAPDADLQKQRQSHLRKSKKPAARKQKTKSKGVEQTHSESGSECDFSSVQPDDSDKTIHPLKYLKKYSKKNAHKDALEWKCKVKAVKTMFPIGFPKMFPGCQTEDESSEDSILEEIVETPAQDVRKKTPTGMKGFPKMFPDCQKKEGR